VVVAASANAEMLDPGDKELGKRVSFIFGDGQRNLVTARATRIFYLWRRPAQLGDGRETRIFYLSLATASATWQRLAHPLSLAAAASANAIMLNPGDKVVNVLFKRAFTLSCSKLMGDRHMPCGMTSLMRSPQELWQYISLGI